MPTKSSKILRFYEVPLTGELTVGTISANQNNWDPWSGEDDDLASLLRVSSDAARDVTGIVAKHGDRLVLLRNVGSFTITLKDASASSTAANRFSFGADFSLIAGACVLLVYSSNDARWKTVNLSGSGGGGSVPSGTGFTHVTAGVQDGAAKLVEAADLHANLKDTGFKAMTGTATKDASAADTSTVTLQALARMVKALQDAAEAGKISFT